MDSSEEEDYINVPSDYTTCPPPTFLKLFHRPNNSLSLEIPAAFFSSLGQSIPDAITLKNTSGMTWRATLQTVDDRLILVKLVGVHVNWFWSASLSPFWEGR